MHGVLRAYSQILFADSSLVGAILLVATFTVPEVGAVGLAGVVAATLLARGLRLDDDAIRSGLLGYNALLVFLAVGALLTIDVAFVAVAAAATALVVVATVALSGALSYHLRLPALSLPFVGVSWVLLAAVPHLKGVAYRRVPALAWSDAPGPEVLDLLLRSLGAIFFQPHWVAGALVLAALVLWSRIATVHALLGFAVAWAADTWLFSFPPDVLHLYIGFNFVLAAVALGGVYYVPGPASLVLAAVGALGSGLVSVGLVQVLAPLGLPVLSAPLCVTVLVTVYALRQRTADTHPRTVDFVAGTPEGNLVWYRTRVRRFRSEVPVRLQLPVLGTWAVSQGNDGAHTHRDAWRHGVDLVVRDADGREHDGDGSALSDWRCHGLPVVAPAAGVVVRVVDGLPDNPVGGLDAAKPWGNAIILRLAPGCYAALAHLAPGSITVAPGEQAAAGQRIAAVGNSGRSPTPHLHVQLQRTPELGAPTRPIRFQDVVLPDTGQLGRDHLPAEDTRVRNVAVDPVLAEAVRWSPGMKQRLRVEHGDVATALEVICELDLQGRWSLRATGSDDRLWFVPGATTWCAVDVTGRSPAFVALYLALATVPLDSAPRLVWRDGLERTRLDGGLAARLREVAAVAWPVDAVEVAHELRRTAEGWTLTAEAASLGLKACAVLDRTGLRTVELTGRAGAVRVVALGERA